MAPHFDAVPQLPLHRGQCHILLLLQRPGSLRLGSAQSLAQSHIHLGLPDDRIVLKCDHYPDLRLSGIGRRDNLELLPFFYGLLAQNLFHCIGQGGCLLGVETPGHHGVSLGTGQIRLIPHIQGGQGLGLLRAQSLKGDIRVRWHSFRVSTSIFSFIHIGVPCRDKGGFARFGADELILLDFSSLLQLGRSGCRNR